MTFDTTVAKQPVETGRSEIVPSMVMTLADIMTLEDDVDGLDLGDEEEEQSSKVEEVSSIILFIKLGNKETSGHQIMNTACRNVWLSC